MQNRYSPPAEWLKGIDRIEKTGQIFTWCSLTAIGTAMSVIISPAPGKAQKDMDGGVLFTQFSHFIDMMYWLFGDINDIKAHFFNFNHQKNTEFDDSGVVSFHFAKQGMGCINFSTSVWDTNFESSITIIGQNGTIKVGGQYMDKIEYCHIKDYTMPTLAPTNPANDYGAYKGSAANHHFIIENVVRTLKGDSTVTTNALEGMKVVDMIERIYAAKNK